MSKESVENQIEKLAREGSVRSVLRDRRRTLPSGHDLSPSDQARQFSEVVKLPDQASQFREVVV
jgi:hypothetical protein